MLLTLRGTPFLYYGEEIGMGDVAIPPEESVDPPARRASPDFPWWDRSQARTPMPWTGGPGAGFTTGRPWQRIAPDAVTRNVAAQLADPRVGAGLLPTPAGRPARAPVPAGRRALGWFGRGARPSWPIDGPDPGRGCWS